jgi:uncharacterized protein YecT (DUF1311 family)
VVRPVIVATLTAAVVVSTAAPSGVRPPVISEGFTLLPCPAHPKTTIDLEGCAEHRLVRSDRAINERVRAIFALLGRRRSAAARARFVRGERAWLVYRRAVCKSRADVYEGGSAGAVADAECQADKNAGHLQDLEAFERALRH